MCGILGILRSTPGATSPEEELRTMLPGLRHRGPDHEGCWADGEAGIALGHTRLSVLDLSPAGHQPMASTSGRYRISFNGEIYNFRALQKELEKDGFHPRGHSDTEVLLAAFEARGVAQTLPDLTGMFSMAVWDRQERVLHLARDRMGEKPLFFGWLGQDLVFASELKALHAHPRWEGRPDRDALTLYMRYAYVPAPWSIHKNIYKLLPGTVLSLRAGQGPDGFSPWPEDEPNPLRPCRFWSVRDTARQGAGNPLEDENEAVRELESLLRAAVGRQMVADVPLGAFLSGGVDSSTVVALMQQLSPRPVKTFTIGFDVPGFNEAGYAEQVAAHLGTDHRTLYVPAQTARDVIPDLPAIYDEPHADSSHIPTVLVSRLARQEVTVSLSGDGGDELFCGYHRYLHSRRIWNLSRNLPPLLRRLVVACLTGIRPDRWDQLFARLPGKIPRAGYKLHKLADGLRGDSLAGVYQGLVSYWQDPGRLIPGSTEPAALLSRHDLAEQRPDFLDQMFYLDQMTYLPDDNLAKIDRAAMSVGLETRAPLLDHSIVEFSWRLAHSLKLRGTSGKWLLRQVLYRYVPRRLIERPKMGFSVPVGTWLRGPLRDWAEDLLREQRLTEDGILNPTLVRRTWAEHLSGRSDQQNALWAVLMFQAWQSHQQT